MFKRLGGPQVIESEPVGSASLDSSGFIQHKMFYDEKALLAVVAALLYTEKDVHPSTAVDRASALIREVNAR